MCNKILLEESKINKLPIIVVQNENKVYIHSKYDPIKEAISWVNDIYESEKNIYVIYGAGLLYHIKELLKIVRNDVAVVVVEPDKNIYDFMISSDIIKDIVDDERFHFILVDNLKKQLRDKLLHANLTNMKICVFGQYERLYPQTYIDMATHIRDILTDQEFYINTKERFSVENANNILNNAVYIEHSCFLDYFAGKFEDVSCVVVSAGPSLEKNIDTLKGMENRVLIITGGRTLKPLLDNGIRPHFVVSVDASYANFELFENVLDCDVPLVAPWVCNKEIIKKYKGEKIFSNSTEIDGLDMRFFGRKIYEIYANGTVSTTQIDFARWIGCKNIALIGQDLADTGGKTHADIASHGKDNREKYRKNIKVKGNVEEFVYTHEIFKHFIDILAHYFEMTEDIINVTNCTEGGAYIQGTNVSTLEEFLNKNAVDDRNFEKEINDIIINNKRKGNSDKIYELFKEISLRTVDTINLSTDGLKIISRSISNKILSDEDNKKLRKIDKKIDKNEQYLEIANALSAKTFDNIEKAVVDTTKSDEEQLIDYLKIKRALYATINGTCRAFLTILNDAIDNLKEYKVDNDIKR